jgi:hypothetical protein
MYYPIKNVLYKDYSTNRTVNIETYFDENSNVTDILKNLSNEGIESLEFDIDKEVSKRDRRVVDSIEHLIDKVIQTSKNKLKIKSMILLQLALLIRFRGGESRLNDFYFLYGSDLKDTVNQIIKLIYIVIKEEIIYD